MIESAKSFIQEVEAGEIAGALCLVVTTSGEVRFTLSRMAAIETPVCLHLIDKLRLKVLHQALTVEQPGKTSAA